MEHLSYITEDRVNLYNPFKGQFGHSYQNSNAHIFDLAIQLGIYPANILEYVQNNICKGNF